MNNCLRYCVALTASLVFASTSQAQVTSFEGTHDLYGRVTHAILTSTPPFSFENVYDQVSPVTNFGPSTASYNIFDQVFIESNISMTSHWNVNDTGISGQLTKSGQSQYAGQISDRVNPYYNSDSKSSLVLQLEDQVTPYKVTISWDLGPVITAGDGNGYSTFHVTVGNAVLPTRIGSIAGGTENNVGLGTNLGRVGTHVFEGNTVTDSLAMTVRIFGPGQTRGANGCFGEPCGTGLVIDDSYVTYEVIVGDDALPLDTDADNVVDSNDNCTEVPNADQYDSNGDGFGNLCDPDLDNNGVVNFTDYSMLASHFLETPDSPTWLPDADFNNDGAVNFSDIAIISSYFLLAPGPSGVAP